MNSSFVPGIGGWKQYYARLIRSEERLRRENSVDSLLDFILTCNHLVDWIEKDPDATSTAKSSLFIYVTDNNGKQRKVPANLWLGICRDIANATKHYEHDSNYAQYVRIESVNWPPSSWYSGANQGIRSLDAHVIVKANYSTENDGDQYLTFDKLVKKLMEYWTSLLNQDFLRP
jgi:hypothetical protein